VKIIRVVPFCLAFALLPQSGDRRFGKPEVELAEPFSQVVGLRELGDGRLLVADGRDRTLQLIDPATGQSSAIGHEGAGPNEWMSLTRLLALPGDTTVMPDPRNGRLLVIGPTGKAVRTFNPAADDAGATEAQRAVNLRSGAVGARASDARGRLYYQGSVISFGGSGNVTLPDSVPLIRYDPAGGGTDTVAYIPIPPRGPMTTMKATGGGMVGMSAPRPFTRVNDWGVLPDGRIAIAHGADYHLEVVGPSGARAVGPKVDWDPVKVTGADKAEFMESMRGSASRSSMTVNGRTVALPPVPEPTAWPETKPPFAAGALAITPAGEVWVLRSRSARDPVPSMDVFDARARRVGRVVLPKGTRLVGFGARSAWLVRTDDDGLQYLQRYAIP
jgi:hypothetical protein